MIGTTKRFVEMSLSVKENLPAVPLNRGPGARQGLPFCSSGPILCMTLELLVRDSLVPSIVLLRVSPPSALARPACPSLFRSSFDHHYIISNHRRKSSSLGLDTVTAGRRSNVRLHRTWTQSLDIFFLSSIAGVLLEDARVLSDRTSGDIVSGCGTQT